MDHEQFIYLFIFLLFQAITSEQTKMARLQQQQQQMFNLRFQNQNVYRGQANVFHTINTNTPINIQQMNPLQRAAFNQYLANMKAQNAAKFANNAANSNHQSTGPVITEPPNENENTSSTGSTTSTIISAPETSTVTISEVT